MEQMDSSENTSGQGDGAVVPDEVKGWNWGAFFLTWIWGIGNSTYIAFLAFIPIFGLVMPFVLGAKGNEWAWRNRTWRDTAQFRKAQKIWGWTGLAVDIVLLTFALAIPTSIMLSMRDNGAFRSSYAAIQNNLEVQATLGKPIKAGWFITGRVYYDLNGGRADLEYSLNGTRSHGRAFVHAIYKFGHWRLERVMVFLPRNGEEIQVIVNGKKPVKQDSI